MSRKSDILSTMKQGVNAVLVGPLAKSAREIGGFAKKHGVALAVSTVVGISAGTAMAWHLTNPASDMISSGATHVGLPLSEIEAMVLDGNPGPEMDGGGAVESPLGGFLRDRADRLDQERIRYMGGTDRQPDVSLARIVGGDATIQAAQAEAKERVAQTYTADQAQFDADLHGITADQAREVAVFLETEGVLWERGQIEFVLEKDYVAGQDYSGEWTSAADVGMTKGQVSVGWDIANAAGAQATNPFSQALSDDGGQRLRQSVSLSGPGL